MVDLIARHLLLQQLLQFLSNNYAIAQHKKEKRMKAEFLIIKIRHVLKRRRLKWNMTRNDEFSKKTKFLSTILGNAFHQQFEEQAKFIFAHFLEQYGFR